MIDAGIYGQVGRGVRSVSDFDREALELDQARQAQEVGKVRLADLNQRMQAAQAEQGRQNQLRSLLSMGSQPEELRRQGFIEQAGQLEQQGATRQSNQMKLDAARLDALRGEAEFQGKAYRALLANPTGFGQQDVQRVVTGLRQRGLFRNMAQAQGVSEDDVALQLISDLPPEQGALASRVRQWADEALGAAEQMKLEREQTDLGDRVMIRLRDRTGKVVSEEVIPKGAAPKAGKGGGGGGGGAGGGSLAGLSGQDLLDRLPPQDAEIVKGLADGSIRPQDVSTAKGRRERMLALVKQYNPDAKPGAKAAQLPTSALKLEQEAREAVGTFAPLNNDIDGFIRQIDSGSLQLGPIANVANRARNFAGMSNEQSRNLATFKSALEKLRNSVLLLNKGVQTEGDAQRAMNEIIENINDPGVVKQQLERLKALNARAVELQKSNIRLIRENYGAPMPDISGLEGAPTSVPSPNRPQQAPASGGWSIREVK